MGASRGPEWDFVEELKRGRNTSHVRCKSCGHEFHGSATRIKEHLFKIGVNVAACTDPPPNVGVKLYKFASKLKTKAVSIKKEKMRQLEEQLCARGCINNDEGSLREPENAPLQHERASLDIGTSNACQSTPPISTAASRQSSKTTSPLHSAFDKSTTLEIHLKWTQAFIACGISFNVIQNPIFQDALMCTARAGSKFTIPSYNKMRTEYLDKVKHTMEQGIACTVLDFVPIFGCTIAFDGWTSCQKKPLINIMCICPRGIVFLDAIDTSLKEKTSSFLAKLYERGIARVGGPKYVTAICTDNASNFKTAGLMIQEKYPDITWIPCAAHTLNLLLKDIGKMNFVQPTLVDANHIVKFIREHQFTYALFCTKSDKCLQIFCATRFATAYYVLERLILVRAALQETIADRRFQTWMIKHPIHTLAASKCVSLVNSTLFWSKVQKIQAVVKPFVELLRVVDTDKFVLGKVYWLMSCAIKCVELHEKLSVREQNEVSFCATERWTMMHTPLHGAAFALDLAFQLHEQSSNKEVYSNFKEVCTMLLPGSEGKTTFHQRSQFSNRIDAFGDEWCLDAIKHLSPPMWWKEHGSQTFELQHIAVRILSVAASSGSCERNWSAYDFIHSKRRNRLKATRASALVYCFCNMRLLHRPQSIATRATEQAQQMPPKLTHEAIAEDRGSEDEEEEWEIDSGTSEVEELDDIVPVLVET